MAVPPTDGEADALGVWDGEAPVEMEAVPVPLLVLVGDAVASDVWDGVPVDGADGDSDTLDVIEGDAPVESEAVGDGATDALTLDVTDADTVLLGDTLIDGLAVIDADTVAVSVVVVLVDAPVDGDDDIDTDGVGVCEGDCDGSDVPVPVGVRVGEGVTGGVIVGVAVPVGVWLLVDVGVGLVRSKSEQMPAPNVLLHVQPNRPLYVGSGSGTNMGTSGQFGLPLLGIVHDAEQQCVSAVVGSIAAPENPLVVVHS